MQNKDLNTSKFWDTIYRTVLIMIIAIVFTRILNYPLWTTYFAIGAGVAVILHALIWIKKTQK